jgi:5-bromo-4-chloroindolyl phosphate hydrolysis protein
MEYSKEFFLKETGLTDNELNSIRETFKMKYAEIKGWDLKNLSSEQINEIMNQDEWKNPLLLS